jgi:hypothetical protein
MYKKNLKLEDVTSKVICDELLGDFKHFKERFNEIKQGTLPVAEHAHPLAISKVDKMEDWPKSFRQLRHLGCVCFVCRTCGLFSECKCSLKAVVGECQGMLLETTFEDMSLRRKLKEKRRKQQ